MYSKAPNDSRCRENFSEVEGMKSDNIYVLGVWDQAKKKVRVLFKCGLVGL